MANRIIHIVLFKFRDEASDAAVHTICAGFLSLKDACINPTTSKPYIKSVRGGKDNPLDGLAAGHTHGFVLEFASEADRDYYVHKDPAHLQFKKDAQPVLGSATVVDFAPGVLKSGAKPIAGLEVGTARNSGVVHIVLFKFKDDTKAQVVDSICQRYLSLRSDCQRSDKFEPYIRRLIGGRDNSPEGSQNGIEYGFVVEFDNVDDCKYYIHDDPVHVKFKQDCAPHVAGAMKLDFEPGVF